MAFGREAVTFKTAPPRKAWSDLSLREKTPVVFILSFIIIFVIGIIIGPDKTYDPKELQFKCASPWDGSSSTLIRKLKAELRDPSSFEHIETKWTRPDVSGSQRVQMRYRAKNGFGGFTVSTAMAEVNNRSCEIEGSVYTK